MKIFIALVTLFDLKVFSAYSQSSPPAPLSFIQANPTPAASDFFYVLCMIVSVDCSSPNHLAVSFTVENVEELFSAIKGQTRCSLIKLVYQGGKMRRSRTVVFSL